jgi:hypothetical protein
VYEKEPIAAWRKVFLFKRQIILDRKDIQRHSSFHHKSTMLSVVDAKGCRQTHITVKTLLQLRQTKYNFCMISWLLTAEGGCSYHASIAASLLRLEVDGVLLLALGAFLFLAR